MVKHLLLQAHSTIGAAKSIGSMIGSCCLTSNFENGMHSDSSSGYHPMLAVKGMGNFTSSY